MKRVVALDGTAGTAPSVWADYFELTKPRITLLVVITAMVGYFMASRTGISVWGLIHTLVGTALVSGGASVLNQVLEREADARMERTRDRALPAGRISPEAALVFGMVLALGGLLYIGLLLNALTTLLAVATLASYVFVYTPLKRVTTLNTLVGAIPGAIPPLGGWAAATGEIPGPAWILFLIVFFWQIPHFLALAWMLREDYERGGFRMLPVVDPSGESTGRHVALSALALLPVSLMPTLVGLTGVPYFLGALGLGLLYGGFSMWMALKPNAVKARWVFLVSIVYLPALLAVMLLDKHPGV